METVKSVYAEENRLGVLQGIKAQVIKNDKTATFCNLANFFRKLTFLCYKGQRQLGMVLLFYYLRSGAGVSNQLFVIDADTH